MQVIFMDGQCPTDDFKWEDPQSGSNADPQSGGNADPNYSKAGTSYNWRNPPDE